MLGLACDVALVAEESRYGCSFMNMGFTPGMGTTRLLASAVGEHIAAEFHAIVERYIQERFGATN